MPFKFNIGTREGKTYKLESEAESLIGKKLGEKIDGKDVSPELNGYEFEIKGSSDNAGFMAKENIEGFGLKKLLVTYGKGMKKRPRREGKKKQLCKKPKGLRLRKTFRGNTISENIVQINLKLLKEGNKKLSEIFPEQNKSAEPEAKQEEKSAEEKRGSKMDLDLENSLKIISENMPEGVFQGCLRRRDFMVPIKEEHGGIWIFIDTQQRLPQTFEEIKKVLQKFIENLKK